MNLLLALAAAAATPAGAADTTTAYDCVLGDIYSVTKDSNGKAVINPIKFGGKLAGKGWRFTLAVDDKSLEVKWPDSPMQLSGKGPLLWTGQSSFASFLAAKGPCLFTEGHCGTMIHIAKQTDGTLRIQLEPTALAKGEDGERVPFVAFIDGTCAAKEASQ